MTVKTDDTEEQVTEETEATKKKNGKKNRRNRGDRQWRLNRMAGLQMAINCIAIKVPPQRKELMLDITNNNNFHNI